MVSQVLDIPFHHGPELHQAESYRVGRIKTLAAIEVYPALCHYLDASRKASIGR
jgi:hypothetical protein